MGNSVAIPSEGLAMRQHADASPTSLYAPDGRRKYVNLSERALLQAELSIMPMKRRLLVLTLMWTGARVSEVLELTPDRFQLDASVVAIRTLKRRKHVVREIPIPPQLTHQLAMTFALAAHQADAALAQQRLWGLHRVTAWRIIKAAMDKAGVHGVRASPRGLRHAFGVAALQSSVPMNLTQRWLGHARMSTTAIYADICGPDEIAFAERFWQSGLKGCAPAVRV